MDPKAFFKGLLPFILGALIGAGFTKNKYVFYIIIVYVVMMALFNLLKNKILKVKESTDKKVEARLQANEIMYDAKDYTAKGNMVGADLFEKFYPNYIFFLNIIILIATILLLFKKEYLYSIQLFAILNFFIVLNQIWRKVKHGNFST